MVRVDNFSSVLSNICRQRIRARPFNTCGVAACRRRDGVANKLVSLFADGTDDSAPAEGEAITLEDESEPQRTACGEGNAAGGARFADGAVSAPAEGEATTLKDELEPQRMACGEVDAARGAREK